MTKQGYIILAIICLIFVACEKEKLDNIVYGSVNGVILDGESYLPVEGAMVTTTPPSIAILSDSEGKFLINKVPEGDLSLMVEKKDYINNTLSVIVFENETTPVDFLIYKDDNKLRNITLYDPVPGNGAVNQYTDITLQWKIEGKTYGADLTFNIFMFESNSTNQKIVGEDIDVTEVVVDGLKNETTYYWYVVAKYDGSKIAYSPTWTFKTE